MNLVTQTTLARLLAKENITIQHGNYTTAFFDVENRLLGLPMWKDKSKDVYDLLVGHEVGHALFTPRDFHHDKRGARKDYVNLIEDVRIERKVQAQYPGLVGCFTRGYSTLKSQDFFGINTKNISSLGFPDRLNLKFKLRNLIDVQFSAAELEIFNQIESVQTWDDVVIAALNLEKFVKEQALNKEQPKKSEASKPQIPQDMLTDPTAQTGESDNSSSDESSDTSEQLNAQDDDKSDEQNKSDSSVKTDAEDSADAKDSTDTKNDVDGEASKDDQQESGKSRGDSDKSVPQNTAPDPNQDSVNTQTAFDENANKHLIDSSRETLRTAFVATPTTTECLENILPFAKLNQQRQIRNTYTAAAANPELQVNYQQFLKSTRKVVSMLAKEFELRKAAYQYSRANVSKTGSLNLSKLHDYKVSDDLFLSVTKLANAKNHGMVMFVDYSGSMTKQLPYVLKHLINMALFCRQVNIPFAVYGFTSDNNHACLQKSVPYYGDSTTYALDTYALDKILMSNTILLELVNSDLNKTDFNAAIYGLYLRSCEDNYSAACEQLGNTPLNETLIIAHDIIKKFRAKHNPDKMTAIFLTDGVGHALRTSTASALAPYRISSTKDNTWFPMRTAFKLNGGNVNADTREMTSSLIKNLRITTGTEVIGFYIPASKKTTRHAAIEALSFAKKSIAAGSQLWTTKFERIYKDEEVISIPGAFNYSNYFIVASGADLSVDDEELTVTADMSRSRIARAFMNYSANKKANRVFVTKFAEAIS